MNMRAWANLLLPDALNTHLDWLRDLVRGDDGMLAQVVRSPAARRLLARKTYTRFGLVPPARATLTATQEWLLATRDQQLALARHLGMAALQECIRRTVNAKAVATLRRELGEDAYRKAMTQPPLAVTGLDAARFREEIERNGVGVYLTAVGAALLESTLPVDEPFYRLRMALIFSPPCWQSRPRGLQVDPQALATQLREGLRA